MNEYEQIIPPVINPHPQHPQPPKKQKNHTFLKLLLASVVCFGGGYGGARYAISTMPQPVPQQATPLPSQDNEGNSIQTTNTSDLPIQDIAQIAAPSVVEIVSTTKQQSFGLFGGMTMSQAAGSGVIISSDGYIITNNHVVDHATETTIKTSEGKTYPAVVVGTDPKTDIAVIKIEANDLTAATIGDSSLLRVGDKAIVIGNPLGTLGGTVTDGIVSAIDREVTINNEAMTLIQTNAAINSGNSGGGMFDGHGRLVGIVNAKDSGTTSSGATIEGLGFAIPINLAMEVANQIMDNGYVADRPTIGVSLQTLTQAYGEYKPGLYIASVVPNSPAEAAGLQQYDRIIAADGNEVSTYPQLSKVLQSKKVNDELVLTIVRDGKQIDYKVILGASSKQKQGR